MWYFGLFWTLESCTHWIVSEITKQWVWNHFCLLFQEWHYMSPAVTLLLSIFDRLSCSSISHDVLFLYWASLVHIGIWDSDVITKVFLCLRNTLSLSPCAGSSEGFAQKDTVRKIYSLPWLLSSLFGWMFCNVLRPSYSLKGNHNLYGIHVGAQTQSLA